MARPSVLVVIPARLGSQRLPRKPLHLLAGRPLVEWVWRRVSSFQDIDAAVVATDSEEVARACRAFGGAVELTASSHPSGTDRVAEVVSRTDYSHYDVVLNVQGDEPLVDADHVTMAARLADGWDVGTIATPIRSAQEWRDPAVVKVVLGAGGRALYFSRAPIPHPRSTDTAADPFATERYLRHVGVYAYTRAALLRWVGLPRCWLEETEQLEQLRPLAAGLTMGVGVVRNAAGGVDTPADARRAEELLRAEHGSHGTNG